MLFAHLLPRVPHATIRNCQDDRRLDLRRYLVSLGFSSRNRVRQRLCVPWCPRLSIETLSCQSHSHQWLQIPRQQTCRTITLRRPAITLQSRQWRPETMVTWSALSLLGRTHHDSQAYGLFSLFCSYWLPPVDSLGHFRSDVPSATARLCTLVNRPHCSTRDRTPETVGLHQHTVLEGLLSSSSSRHPFRERTSAYDS